MPPRKQAQKAQADEVLSFEEILGQLEQVVGELEDAELPLEQALGRFERGVGLARLGARRLDEVEQRIEVLLSDDDGVSTRPMDKEPLADE